MPQKLSTHLGSCIGLASNLTPDHSPMSGRSRKDKYDSKNFYDGKNYQLIIDCLDGGTYIVCLFFFLYILF